MTELIAFQVNCFFIGFIGGMCGMSIALFGLRQFFVRHYLRYSRTKDYINLHNKVCMMASDAKLMQRKLSQAQHDIIELFQDNTKKVGEPNNVNR